MQVQIPHKISTGTAGLDEVLEGGLIARRRYLVRGRPGGGKTTPGLSVLTAGDGDNRSLFIGFQEPAEELRANAASLGLDVSAVEFLSLAPSEEFFTERESYDVFAASGVEHKPLVDAVVGVAERVGPTPVFVGSMTQLRFLTADVHRYRKQTLSFLRFLIGRGATVMFTSESSENLADDDLRFLSDRVIDWRSGF